MATSDERRKVAEDLRDLRDDCYHIRYAEQFYEELREIVALDLDGTFEGVANSLADLIDPTCAAAGCTNYEKGAAMAVEIGTVQTFAGVSPDKAQALKVLEEAAEVFGAWQLWDGLDPDEKCDGFNAACLMSECADVIQATCNLLTAYGVTDFTAFMEGCRRRNVERGRYEL